MMIQPTQPTTSPNWCQMDWSIMIRAETCVFLLLQQRISPFADPIQTTLGGILVQYPRYALVARDVTA